MCLEEGSVRQNVASCDLNLILRELDLLRSLDHGMVRPKVCPLITNYVALWVSRAVRAACYNHYM